jgi:hypothetical protein
MTDAGRCTGAACLRGVTMNPYQKRLLYLDLLAALMILVGIAFINWMDTGCAPGNC